MKKNTRLALCLIAALSGGVIFHSIGMETERSDVTRSDLSRQVGNDPIIYGQNNSNWDLVFEFDNQHGEHQTITIHPNETMPLAQASKLKNLKYHGGRGASLMSWQPQFGDKLQSKKDLVIVIGINRFRNWTEAIREYTQAEQSDYKRKKEQPEQTQGEKPESKEQREQEETAPFKMPVLRPRMAELEASLAEKAKTRRQLPTGAVDIYKGRGGQ